MLNHLVLSFWLVLALGSAVFLGAYEVARKGALVENASLPVLLAATLGGWAALSFALLVFGPSSCAQRYDFAVHALTVRQHAAILLKAAIVSTSWVFAYVSVKRLPITIAGPLRAFSPALTVLGALLLFNEAPTTMQWLGMFIMFAGYVLLSRAGQREGISFINSRWVWLLMMGTFIGAMSGLYDKHLLQTAALPPTTLQFWFTTYAVLLQAILVFAVHRATRANPTPYRFSWAAPLAGLMLIVADQLYFRALAQPDALVSVVALVRRSSALVSFGLGTFLFRDQFVRNKAVALGVVLLGLFVLLAGR